MQHDLKSWPANFKTLLDGRRFEVRLNDRNFALGDHVHLVEFLPAAESLTGRCLDFVIDDVAPMVLPNEPIGPQHRHVILHYMPIRTVTLEPVQDPPPRPRAKASLELWARMKVENPVMQIVEDQRGEQHQITGAGMADGAQVGAAGIFRQYPGGAKSFELARCEHSFPEGSLTCEKCHMPSSLA